jgi:hypothetical protein
MPICPFDTTTTAHDYVLLSVLADGSIGVAGTPLNPQIGVVSSWAEHWSSAQWQTSDTHLE